MNDNSYTNWNAYTDKGLLEHIGQFMRYQRLQQNKTQSEVSTAAGISRSTLSLLERGETVTTTTLLQVLRVLNLLHLLSIFNIEKMVSPIAIAKAQEKERQRASGGNIAEEPKEEWEW